MLQLGRKEEPHKESKTLFLDYNSWRTQKLLHGLLPKTGGRKAETVETVPMKSNLDQSKATTPSSRQGEANREGNENHPLSKKVST